MCFWFGLEILRLIYKKSVFWNIEWFLSYLTFYPSKKVAPPLIGVEKKFLQNWACRVSKEGEFALISKMCRSLEFGKKIYRKTNLLGTFWNRRKIALLLISFAYKKKISTLKRGGTTFLEDKRSNKIETDQYFKKRFFTTSPI